MEMAPKKWLLMPEPGRKVKCWARVELLRVYLPCCHAAQFPLELQPL